MGFLLRRVLPEVQLLWVRSASNKKLDDRLHGPHS
jgi:hypothetical protein